MYLHIGQGQVVPFDDIIGIFDMDTTTYSKISREFLNTAQKKGQMTTVGSDIPKSFLLCSEGKTEDSESERVYLTQLGTPALRMRSETFSVE